MALGALAIGGGLSAIGGGLGAIGGSAIAGNLIGNKKSAFGNDLMTGGKSNWIIDGWKQTGNAINNWLIEQKAKNGELEAEAVKPSGETPEVNDTNQAEETTEEEQAQQKETFDKAYMEEMLKKQWEREDMIRKETQEREDSALQRWVKDAKKAGINPNLAIGMKGAESGGGITTATGLDYGGYSAEIQKYTAELNAEIEKGEGNKDRINSIVEKIISAAAMIGMAFISKGKTK